MKMALVIFCIKTLRDTHWTSAAQNNCRVPVFPKLDHRNHILPILKYIYHIKRREISIGED